MIVIAIKEKEFGLVKLRTSMIPKLREISQITGNFFQSGNFQADGRTHTHTHRVTAGPSCFHNIDCNRLQLPAQAHRPHAPRHAGV